MGAKKVSLKKTKTGNKNQQPFERIMIMEYDVHFIGRVKMTVGIRRRTHERCSTASQPYKAYNTKKGILVGCLLFCPSCVEEGYTFM